MICLNQTDIFCFNIKSIKNQVIIQDNFAYSGQPFLIDHGFLHLDYKVGHCHFGLLSWQSHYQNINNLYIILYCVILYYYKVIGCNYRSDFIYLPQTVRDRLIKQQFGYCLKSWQMLKTSQTSHRITILIKSFKSALSNNFGSYQIKRYLKDNQLSNDNFYEDGKRAETEQRNLWKALELYIKAIQNGQKKDSTIKDFASSLHQLGYTKQAVRFMDDCQIYYDGNKDKYFRLRDNLQLQIRPTGKHECRYLLVQNLSQELKCLQNKESLKESLFKSPKRIRGHKSLQNLDLTTSQCSLTDANNILFQFQSFSAAKKTLQSFYFQEWFGSNIYWVNSSMRIVCAATDGKKDFEEGLIVDEGLLTRFLCSQKQNIWAAFGQQTYSDKSSNGFVNLLSTHIIKQHLSQSQYKLQNKQNIFESSKINQSKNKLHDAHQYHQNCMNLCDKSQKSNKIQQKSNIKYYNYRNYN